MRLFCNHGIRWGFVFPLLLLVGACKKPAVKPPPPSRFEVVAEAGPMINRDGTGNPLSVVVRLYQLKDKTEFNKLTFDTATSGRPEAELLGQEFVGKTELQLVPGGRHMSSEDLLASTKYIGVVGIFRNPEPNFWRQIVSVEQMMPPAPKDPKAEAAKVKAERKAEAVKAKEEQQKKKELEEARRSESEAWAKAAVWTAERLRQENPEKKELAGKEEARFRQEAQKKQEEVRKKESELSKKPEGNWTLPRVAFKVEDCYLMLVGLKGETIPGRSENAKPECGPRSSPPTAPVAAPLIPPLAPAKQPSPIKAPASKRSRKPSK